MGLLGWLDELDARIEGRASPLFKRPLLTGFVLAACFAVLAAAVVWPLATVLDGAYVVVIALAAFPLGYAVGRAKRQ